MSDLDNFLLSQEAVNLSMEDVYKAVMYSSPDGIGITDLKGNFVSVSCSALEMLHISSNKQILGKNLKDFIIPADYEYINNRIQSLTQGRKPERIEVSIKRPDDSCFYADVKGDIVRDSKGNPTHYIFIVRDITQTKENDQLLAKQNARFSAILKSIPDLMFVLDHQGTYFEVIASDPSQLIMEQENIIGKNISEFFSTDETANHLSKIKECIQTQKLVNYEYTLLENSFKTFWEARLTPMQDNLVLCFVRDITRKKEIENEILRLNSTLEDKIEERTKQLAALNRTLMHEISIREEATKMLQQNNLNFRTFFDAVDDYLFVLNMQKEIIHCNATAIVRLGYSEQEITGMPFEKIHFEDRIPGVHCCLEEIISGNQERCIVPLVTKHKEYIPIETNIKKGEWNGEPVIFVAAKDITDLKFTEEKFARAFQSKSALQAIMEQDSQRILDVNNTFATRLGYTRDYLIGKTPIEFNLMDDYSIQNQMKADLLATGSCMDYELLINTADGNKVPVLFSADQIFIGKQKCLIIMMLDISERKQFEAEIMKNKIEAEKANLAKSEFLSRMSHELRTPLNSILGFAQLMEMTELTEIQKKGVGHILESGKHLLDLINEVLDISKIEAGKYNIQLTAINISLVIHELTDSIKPVADKSKITVIVEDLSEDMVLADNKFIRQIMLNLLSNAIKYNKPEGFVWISSRTLLNDDGRKMCRIIVKDSGIGIPENKINRVFTPFERIGAENLEIEGTGLGLAVVDRLVKAMNGSIGLTSVYQEGSTFWIELPLAD